MTTYVSQDNGHSLAGLYGLANPTVTWLINRGHGELVALAPTDLKEGDGAPRCPGRHERAPAMLWRGNEWVCYAHDKPIRRHIPLRLQRIPPFPGGLKALLAVADKTVEVQYRSDPPGKKPAWHYYVDGELVE